jgi:thiol-disulfide isomerase/thioredoxin
MKKLIAGVAITLALCIGVYLYHKYRVAPDIKFQTLELTDLNGQPVNLQSYKGKKLLLNFYATWCGPCRGEFASLNKAAEILAPDNFLFISISDEPLALLNRFNKQLNASHIILLHSVKKLHNLGVFTVPTNYLLNNKGEVVFEKIGEQDWSTEAVTGGLKKKAE